MRAVDIIMKKRNGGTLSREEINFLIGGYVNGSIPDYQMSAWLMAVCFSGMTFDETGILTDAMLHSGDVIDLSGIDGFFADKHSTGGVGDKISLPLAPIVAACGVKVPMMSGRALGHTGGTLDKLESINGYNVRLTQEQLRSYILHTGFAMTGQTEKIVPADRLLYALRDVTGTVESIPLITASIVSKKVAEGSNGLVFDVKCGSGAFMKKLEDAQALAESLVGTCLTMGKKVNAVITNMNEPLGNKVGNFLEIEETVDCLTGKGPADVMEITYACAARMVLMAGCAETLAIATAMCKNAVSSGKAMELFMQNVADQGGCPDQLLAEIGIRRSAYTTQIVATQDGFIAGIDAMKTGLAGVYLGVGRNRTDEQVCPEAGMIIHAHSGSAIKKGDVIMDIYGKTAESLESAVTMLNSAITYAQKQPEKQPLILGIIE